MRLNGAPRLASQDLASFMSTLKLGGGRWKDLNGKNENGEKVKIYLAPDRNPFHIKMAADARKLATALRSLVKDDKVRIIARDNGVVESGFQPVARVLPKASDGPKLSKLSVYRSGVTALKITKTQLQTEYAKQRKESVQIDMSEWSDAESGDEAEIKGF